MLMKYKDFKVMSQNEMKKVNGGVAEWVAICEVRPFKVCYEHLWECQQFCDVGQWGPCHVAEGYDQCGS